MTTLPASNASHYARDLTDRIKRATDQLWELLLEAWEGEAYKHLGYKSWSAYIDGEFDFSRQQSYYLLNQGKVTKALREAGGLSNAFDTSSANRISIRDADAIAPVLPQVTERVRERVASGWEPSVAVETTVAEVRTERRTTTTPRPYANEEPDYGHQHECRICGLMWQE